MTPNQTRLLLLGGAALTGALIWFAPGKDDLGVSEPVKGGNALKLRPASAASSPLEGAAKGLELGATPERGSLNKKDAAELFAKSTWVIVPPPPKPVPPPPPVEPPPPPPPTAPPLPYAFMGKFEQGDTLVVILTRGNRVLTASAGETLENVYRIERIEASKVTFTYLPLGTLQSLSTGGSQ